MHPRTIRDSPHHARRYFRRAQANEDELLVDFYRAQNPLSVEKSVWNPNGTDVALIFCIEPGEGAVTKNDINAIQLLEHVKITKKNWIDAGKRPERCAQPWLSHNVSNTINVRDGEWKQVEDYIYDNCDSFAGISLLPEGGDLDYPQAPFCAVPTAAEIISTTGAGLCTQISSTRHTMLSTTTSGPPATPFWDAPPPTSAHRLRSQQARAARLHAR